MRVGLLSYAVLVAISAVACSKSEPGPSNPTDAATPTCETTVDHVVEILKSAPEMGSKTLDQISSYRGALFAECKDRGWDRSKMDCALAARSRDALVACGTVRVAPTCEDAVDHATALIMNSEEMKKATDEERKLAEAMVKGMKGEMVKKCKEENWDTEQLQCVMDSKKMDDMEKCDTKQ